MQKSLSIDMGLIEEAKVAYAVSYLLESVEDMMVGDDVSLTEALLALGQAAGHLVDMMESKGTVH